jgi:hyperosmotically inducible periplasmic protein
MTKPQLLTGAVALTLIASAGCNRTDTSREARETTAEVKVAAARAGEKLADSWLTTKVQAQYFADDDIKARYINVTSRDGIVTLKGFVENENVRRQALEIARNTDGVRQINDQLTIGQAPTRDFETGKETGAVATTGGNSTYVAAPSLENAGVAVDDSMIRSRIQAKYFLDGTVKARSIDVDSTNGVVTLRGQVASDNERAQALLLARSTEGVQRVEDNLTIDASLVSSASPVAGVAAPAPQASASAGASAAVGTTVTPTEDTGLERTLKEKLAADAPTKTAAITVSARDGVVLLEGTVPNQAAKQHALSVARQTPGVVQVVDRITVAPRR